MGKRLETADQVTDLAFKWISILGILVSGFYVLMPPNVVEAVEDRIGQWVERRRDDEKI